MKKIECVIMDWAGSAVDYGCFAPVAAFINSFKGIDVPVTAEEARKPMGLTKIDHVRALFKMERIGGEFKKRYGRAYNEDDVQGRYGEFKKNLFATLTDFTDPIPGVVETINGLREKGIRIGSTTGYTKEMMDVVVPAAASKGYKVDNWVTSDNLPAGRPYPYMIYKNMCDLAIPSRFSVLKYGDTVSDVKEGVNAGVWSVGVVMGSNVMGLTEDEVNSLPADELNRRKLDARMKLYAAGAHYVVDNITELPALIDAINARMENE